MKFVLFLSCLFFSLNSFAGGILCSRDDRPVDGDYSEVRLIEVNGSYQLSEKTMTAGFGAPVETRENILATNLECRIQELLAYCVSKSRTPYSRVTFSRISETSLPGLSDAMAKVTNKIHISVYVGPVNPEDSATDLKLEFKERGQFGSGCQEILF